MIATNKWACGDRHAGRHAGTRHCPSDCNQIPFAPCRWIASIWRRTVSLELLRTVSLELLRERKLAKVLLARCRCARRCVSPTAESQISSRHQISSRQQLHRPTAKLGDSTVVAERSGDFDRWRKMRRTPALKVHRAVPPKQFSASWNRFGWPLARFPVRNSQRH